MARVLTLLVVWLAMAAAMAHAADDGAAVVNKRAAAQASYEAFLQLAPADDPRRASALRRLGDLQLERAENLQLEGAELATSLPVYERAIALYLELLSSYPEQPDNDTVLYQLARAYEQSGDIASAIVQLKKMEARYPESIYLDESGFRRGEAHFSSGDYDLAAQAYRVILDQTNATDSSFYQSAQYKFGWSQFRLGEYNAALDAFLVLLNHELAPQGDYSKARHDDLPAGRKAVIDDAVRAMSISYSYLGGVESLNALLKRASAKGFEFLLYADLGDHYLEQERYSDAALSYQAFVTDYPSDSNAPHLQLRVIDTYQAAGFAEQELAAREDFVKRYALARSDGYWARHDRESSADVVTAIKTNLAQLSRHYHALAATDPPAVDKAEGFYRAWLTSFPGDKAAPENHFLLAELLFTHQRFAAATAAYEAAAYDYGSHARAAEAGYASLLAYAQHEQDLPTTEQAAWQQRAIGGALRFSASFAQHPEANNVLTNAAERLFKRGQFGEAADAARRLLAVTPAATAELRQTAWTVVGHASFDLGNFVDAEEAYVQILALATTQPDERDVITERLAASVYKQGEERRAAGELTAAVNDFLRVADVAPGSPIRVQADYDAAAVLIQLEDWSLAASVLEGFRVNHAGHALASDVGQKLSVVYLKAGRFAEAAGELEGIARDENYPRQTRHDALWEAAALYAKGQDISREAAVMKYFLNALDGTLDQQIDARQHLAVLSVEVGDYETQRLWLREIVTTHKQAAAPSQRSLSAAADAALKLADAQLPQFTAVQLVVPLQDNLRRKKDAMENLLAAYGDAASYSVAPVTTAATFQIGELYRQMAAALMDSERPAQLSAEELEEYDFLLEDQAFPFEEKAIEVHEANAQRAAGGNYDAWVRKSFQVLALLIPARYAKFEKGEIFAQLAQ